MFFCTYGLYLDLTRETVRKSQKELNTESLLLREFG